MVISKYFKFKNNKFIEISVIEWMDCSYLTYAVYHDTNSSNHKNDVYNYIIDPINRFAEFKDPDVFLKYCRLVAFK